MKSGKFDMSRKVSITMTSYNHDKYIADAIESVLKQTYKNWELLIVDDGSTDRSVEIIQSYVTRYPDNIRLFIHPEHSNRNIVQSYQLGLKNAAGDYAAFLESDDIWLEDSLRLKVDVLNKYDDVILVYTDVESFGESGKWRVNRENVLEYIRKENSPHKNKPFIVAKPLRGNIIPSFSVIMVRRLMLGNIDFCISKEYEPWFDCWLWGQIGTRGKFFYIPKTLTKWRVHDASYNAKLDKSLRDPDKHFSSFIKELNHVIEKPTKKTVAIIAPMYKKDLTPDEEISLQHLRHFLGHYDKYFISPKGLHIDVEHRDFKIKRFSKKYFLSKETYSRLLVSKKFYETFRNYEYILIHQLDCLVFSDQLLEWCKKGYGYIGAPWYRECIMREEGWVPKGDAVGNGAFSLRKVESFIKVLNIYNSPLNVAKRKILAYSYLISYYLSRIPVKVVDLVKGKQYASEMLKNAYIKKQSIGRQENEDLFWSHKARKWYPDFKIAPPDEAVYFSFEVEPEYCFEKTKHTLPFGCHGWYKYNREFWEKNSEILLPKSVH